MLQRKVQQDKKEALSWRGRVPVFGDPLGAWWSSRQSAGICRLCLPPLLTLCLLLSVWLRVTLLHVTCVMQSARDDRGAPERKSA